MIARADQTLTHERQGADAHDQSGGRLNEWSAVNADVPCWLQPATASVQERYDARQIRVTHVCYVAPDLDGHENDRLTIGGTIYVVAGYADASGGLGRLFCFDLEEAR